MYRIEKVETNSGGCDLDRKQWELNKGFAGFIGMTGKAVII